MPAQYLVSFIEHFRVREKALFAYLLIVLVVYLILLAALHLPATISTIRWRHRLKVARSKEFALFVALNQMESYTAENYCAVCCSSATSRCPKCGAVAYCSEKCQRDHWEQLHNKECPLMAEFKGCTMAHLATYSHIIKQCKPCKVATAKTMELPRFIARKSNGGCVVVNSNSLSKNRPSIKPQLLGDGRKTKRISSPRPSYSSYRDSSDSGDTMSSLHGLD